MGTERVRKGCWYGEGMGGLLGGGGAESVGGVVGEG